jgi:hypothetical protein
MGAAVAPQLSRYSRAMTNDDLSTESCKDCPSTMYNKCLETGSLLQRRPDRLRGKILSRSRSTANPAVETRAWSFSQVAILRKASCSAQLSLCSMTRRIQASRARRGFFIWPPFGRPILRVDCAERASCRRPVRESSQPGKAGVQNGIPPMHYGKKVPKTPVRLHY